MTKTIIATILFSILGTAALAEGVTKPLARPGLIEPERQCFLLACLGPHIRQGVTINTSDGAQRQTVTIEDEAPPEREPEPSGEDQEGEGGEAYDC